jgi:hypothetical protein
VAIEDHTEAFGGVMAVPTLIVFDQQGRASSVSCGAPPILDQRVERAVAGLLPGFSLSLLL